MQYIVQKCLVMVYGKILTAMFLSILMWFGNFLWGFYIGQTGRDIKTCYEDKV